ncbi:hypothetical protein OROMI_000423 [Orobanche minor]
MASPIFQKLLLRNQYHSAFKTLTYFRQPSVIPEITKTHDTASSLHPPETYCSKPTRHSFGSHFYPSFPFGFFLDPISPTQLIRFETEEETTPDESVIIRADSVKKKRKKKMNKHKLRKLRKRLRRKT